MVQVPICTGVRYRGLGVFPVSSIAASEVLIPPECKYLFCDQEFLGMCLQPDPKTRATVEELLTGSFVLGGMRYDSDDDEKQISDVPTATLSTIHTFILVSVKVPGGSSMTQMPTAYGSPVMKLGLRSVRSAGRGVESQSCVNCVPVGSQDDFVCRSEPLIPKHMTSTLADQFMRHV